MSKGGKLKAIKGMNDVMPGHKDAFLESGVWDFIVDQGKRTLEGYGYQRLQAPICEPTALFARGLGDTTDIVSKEMYSFEDRGGRAMTLRPEGTASAVRAYIEHGHAQSQPLQRWWYFGPMFRAERPQKGRYRQFYQIGAEFFGVSTPESEIEMLLMLKDFLTSLGLTDAKLRLNSLGDAQSRLQYRSSLVAFFREHEATLSDEAKALIDVNPLRILDSKRAADKEVCEHAPDILESFTEEARAHFQQVCDGLKELGVEFDRDSRLVRGLDYYTGTIFEFTTSRLGAQDAILGGGRYDGLVEELGGPSIPAIGFAAGVERLALLVANERSSERGGVYIAPCPAAAMSCLSLASELRRDSNARVEVDVVGGRLKQQLKRADRAGAHWIVIVGEQEWESKTVAIKNLETGEQSSVEHSVTAIRHALKGLGE